MYREETDNVFTYSTSVLSKEEFDSLEFWSCALVESYQWTMYLKQEVCNEIYDFLYAASQRSGKESFMTVLGCNEAGDLSRWTSGFYQQ